MHTPESDDRPSPAHGATSRQPGAHPPEPVKCDACGVAGCVGECAAAEGATRASHRAGVLIVLVGLAFLLCPGCASSAAGAERAPTNAWDAVIALSVAAAVAFGLDAALRYSLRQLCVELLSERRAARVPLPYAAPEFLQMRDGCWRRPEGVFQAVVRPGGGLWLYFGDPAQTQSVAPEYAAAWREALNLSDPDPDAHAGRGEAEEANRLDGEQAEREAKDADRDGGRS